MNQLVPLGSPQPPALVAAAALPADAPRLGRGSWKRRQSKFDAIATALTAEWRITFDYGNGAVAPRGCRPTTGLKYAFVGSG